MNTQTERVWDGYVLSIGRKYFWARLGDEFDARLPISKVTKRDRNVFQAGALFNLRITGSRASLRFNHRRWTKKELDSARERAKEMMTHLKAAEVAI